MGKNEKVQNSDDLLFQTAALWLGTFGLTLIMDLPKHHKYYFSFHCDELLISQIVPIGEMYKKRKVQENQFAKCKTCHFKINVIHRGLFSCSN